MRQMSKEPFLRQGKPAVRFSRQVSSPSGLAGRGSRAAKVKRAGRMPALQGRKVQLRRALRASGQASPPSGLAGRVAVRQMPKEPFLRQGKPALRFSPRTSGQAG